MSSRVGGTPAADPAAAAASLIVPPKPYNDDILPWSADSPPQTLEPAPKKRVATAEPHEAKARYEKQARATGQELRQLRLELVRPGTRIIGGLDGGPEDIVFGSRDSNFAHTPMVTEDLDLGSSEDDDAEDYLDANSVLSSDAETLRFGGEPPCRDFRDLDVKVDSDGSDLRGLDTEECSDGQQCTQTEGVPSLPPSLLRGGQGHGR